MTPLAAVAAVAATRAGQALASSAAATAATAASTVAPVRLREGMAEESCPVRSVPSAAPLAEPPAKPLACGLTPLAVPRAAALMLMKTITSFTDEGQIRWPAGPAAVHAE